MKKYILTILSILCTSILPAGSVDLSVSGTANCYIVPAGAGQYSFNALVKGNGVAVCGLSATIDRYSQSRGSDFYIWNAGVGIAIGSNYYNCSAFSIRPQKF